MNPAHSFLYVIHDEEINDSVLFTVDSLYYRGVLNRYADHDLEALDAHPEKWELYAASGDNTDKAGYLYQVNPQTGDLTEIGPTGFREIEGLSFRADETLWAWAKGEGLIQVNPQTAESKLILPSEVEIEALTWKDEKVLYLGQGTDLWKYDGQQLKLACDISKYTQGKSIEALEMMPNNTLVVGLHGKRNLLQLNVLSVEPCFISKSQEIASEHNDIEGIAYTKVRPLSLGKPGIWPDSLKPGVSTNVGVSLKISGGPDDKRDIPSLLLEEITKEGPMTLGQLYDDGTHGDLQADDYLYMGQFAVQKRVEGEYCYRVKTAEHVAGVELVTAATCLWVVSLPTQHVPSEIAVDEGVVLTFTDDTSVLRIKEIILAEGATVLADIPVLNELLVRIESLPRSNVIARFEKYPEVSWARPNRWGRPAGHFPNDPEFPAQESLTQIRANEVFYIAKGKMTVAVVDSGVDYTHPELVGKVIKGWDFESEDFDPIDEGIKGLKHNRHGTRVAAIIAAHSNNGIGMTGVSWNSKIHAVRAMSLFHQREALTYAAKKANIINFSFALSDAPVARGEFQKMLKDVDTSQKLFVSVAGNDRTVGKVTIPCGLPGIFCVGGTTRENQVATQSNLFSSIDIFAPYTVLTVGEEIGEEYYQDGGTSFSAPLVSGAASIVWSLHPTWDATQVKDQLVKTAKFLPKHKKQSLHSITETFPSQTKLNDLEGWSVENEESCYTTYDLGNFDNWPKGESRFFLVCTTQESDVLLIRREIDIHTDVTKIGITFHYNFITQEYPAMSATDNLSVWVKDISDSSTKNSELLIYHDNGSYSSLSQDTLQFPDREIVGAKTGWLEKYHEIEPPFLPTTGGKLALDFIIRNNGDKNQYPFIFLKNLRVDRYIETEIPARSVKQLDVFEAVFGGSFESPLPLTGWTLNGSCYTAFDFGQFRATDRERFLVCNTYPNEESAWISREIDIPEGVTSLPLSLDYNFLSQEFPGNGLSDWDIIELSIKSANGNVTRLVAKSSDDISMVEDTLYIGENQLAIGRTGWQTLSVDVPVSSGKGEIKIMLSSEGKGNGLHSALLVDNIRFAPSD